MKIPMMQTLLTLSLLSFAGCQSSDPEAEIEHHEEESHHESVMVHLDKHKVFHAGLRIQPVESRSLAIPLTLPGKISFNERRIATIAARVSGRIEKINVATNDRVNEGEPLLQLYSQEFITAQNELILAAERSANPQQGEPTTFYDSARRKLAVLGVNEDDLKEIETSRTPMTYFTVRAPFDGTILQCGVRPGAFVTTGTQMLEIADLSNVWILADIYEKDLPYVHAGMTAQVVVPAYADSFAGTITSIYNVMDEKTRTVKARVEVKNRRGRLKPEMFCSVLVNTQLDKETIKIPASALLGDTEHHYVFVAVNDTTFEKRDVRTGVETREFAEVLDGLLIGERLVVKGGFFLKSELAKETFGEEHGH